MTATIGDKQVKKTIIVVVAPGATDRNNSGSAVIDEAALGYFSEGAGSVVVVEKALLSLPGQTSRGRAREEGTQAPAADDGVMWFR